MHALIKMFFPNIFLTSMIYLSAFDTTPLEDWSAISVFMTYAIATVDWASYMVCKTKREHLLAVTVQNVRRVAACQNRQCKEWICLSYLSHSTSQCMDQITTTRSRNIIHLRILVKIQVTWLM